MAYSSHFRPLCLACDNVASVSNQQQGSKTVEKIRKWTNALFKRPQPFQVQVVLSEQWPWKFKDVFI